MSRVIADGLSEAGAAKLSPQYAKEVDLGTASTKNTGDFEAAGSSQQAVTDHAASADHDGRYAKEVDLGTAATNDTDDFEPAGSAAVAESRLRETLRQRPDPLLMHFL